VVRADLSAQPVAQSSTEATVARTAIVLTIVILASRVWPLFHRAIDIDEFEHAHATWRVAAGEVPYRDFFEHHTPALYFAFAPLFAGAPVDRDADAAFRVLLLCRAAMLALTVAAVSVTYRLAAGWRGPLAGALAAIFLVTSEQFLNSMMEFRPDVPAVVCTLVAFGLAMRTDRRPVAAAAALALASGALFATAVLCTQKAVFAGPGILAAAVFQRRRHALVAAWAAGVAIPVLATLTWFAAHHALEPFFFANAVMNARLNADRFATLPRLVRHVAHHPALYLIGFAGVAGLLRSGSRDVVGFSIGISAVSLLAGAFVLGKPYDQYYALMLPVLAVAAGGWAVNGLRRPPRWRTRPPTGTLVWIGAAGGTAAFLLAIRPLATPVNAAMAAAFSAAVLLAALAFHLCGRRPAASAVCGLLGLCSLLAGNLVREFDDNRSQIDDMRWVMAQTRPTDTVLSGYQSVSAFRPRAWYFFFLTGPFATAEDYAALFEGLRTGRIRPRLIVFGGTLTQAPQPVLDYIHEHYRRARGDILERID
jgi:hypothetical protein